MSVSFGGTSVLIILGDDVNLKADFLRDAAHCVDYFVKDKDTKNYLLDQLFEYHKLTDTNSVFSSAVQNVSLTVIDNPPVGNLKCGISEWLDIPATWSYFIYCGHGDEHGGLYIGDYKWAFSELVLMIEEEKKGKPPNYNQLYCVLNCCFAAQICATMMNKSPYEVIDYIRTAAQSKYFGKEGEELFSKDSEIWDQFLTLCLLPPNFQDSATSEVIKRLHSQLLQAFCISALEGLSLVRVPLNNMLINLVPLSIGPLEAVGHICELLGDSTFTTEINEEFVGFDGADLYRTLAHDRPYNANDIKDVATITPIACPEYEHIQIECFQAEEGDSTLISCKVNGKTYRILIDGGNSYTPTFYPRVQDTGVDIAILTHGDGDHVNGLQTYYQHLFAENDAVTAPSLLICNAMCCLTNCAVCAKRTKGKVKILLRSFQQANNLVSLAHSIENMSKGPCGFRHANTWKLKDSKISCICVKTKEYVEILFILPLSEFDDAVAENASKAKAEPTKVKKIGKVCIDEKDKISLKNARDALCTSLNLPKSTVGSLTPINVHSIAFVVRKFVKNVEVFSGLFTGDADGRDVVIGLERRGIVRDAISDRYKFNYVDMPHHGAATNSPQHFLQSISADTLVISTNKNNHRPSPSALQALKDNLAHFGEVVCTYDDVRDQIKESFKVEAEKSKVFGPNLVSATNSWKSCTVGI